METERNHFQTTFLVKGAQAWEFRLQVLTQISIWVDNIRLEEKKIIFVSFDAPLLLNGLRRLLILGTLTACS